MAEFKLGRLKFVWKGAWVASATYVKDDIIKFGGKTYVCVSGHVASAANQFYSDEVHWNQMTDGQLWAGAWSHFTYYNLNDIVKVGGKTYICTTPHESGSNSAAFYTDIANWELYGDGFKWRSVWDTSEDYNLNDIVSFGSGTYICIIAHTSIAEFQESKWEVFNEAFQWENSWNNTDEYQTGDVVAYGGYTYAAVTRNTGTIPSENISIWKPFIEGTNQRGTYVVPAGVFAYRPGDYVTYSGEDYMAIRTSYTETPSDTEYWSPLQGTFINGTQYYKDETVVYSNGQVYIALVNNINISAYAQPATWKLVAEAVNTRGAWEVADITEQPYRVGDIVQFGGNNYIAIQDNYISDHNPENDSYWTLCGEGLKWQGTWSNAGIRYKIGEVVKEGTSSYVCINHNTSTSLNSPSADIAHAFWEVLADGSASAVVTTRGDTLYRDSTGAVRKPIGAANDLYVVNQAGTEPEWSTTADVTVNSIAITTGDIGPLTLGNISTAEGYIKTTLGDIGTEAGDIYTTLGNINAADGDVTAAFNITANSGNISVTSAGDIGTANGDLYTNNGSVLITGDITTTGVNDNGGKLTVTHNITTDSDGTNDASLYVGIDAELSTTEGPTFTDASAVLRRDAPAFVQMALQNINSTSSASTDMIVYADNGDNDSGWMDMGITSSTYADASYGITGPNDGYIFMSAPAGTTGNGNLYISTNNTGMQNDIILSTDGFGQVTSEKMRLIGHAHDGLDPGLVINVTVTTLLTSSINNSTDIILVDDTAAFPTIGTIKIGSEQITYTSTNATEFIDCTRGANGTTAASHTGGVEVAGASASVSPTTGALRVTGGIGLTGSLNAEGDIIAFGGAIYQGRDGGVTAKQLTIDDQLFPGYVGLTNSSGIFTGDQDAFVQFALKNHSSGTAASTDIIAYSSNGDNNSGWIDIGITSENFSDPNFTVTGPNTGYLFMSAPNDGLVTVTTGTHTSTSTTINVGSTADFPSTGTCVVAGGGQFSYTGKTSTSFTGCTRGVNNSNANSITAGTRIYKLSTAAYTGDLLVGTGTGGSHNDIVVFSGGFDAGNERIRIIGNTRAGHASGVEILAGTVSSSTTTGALRVNGGIGLIGNLNVGGDVGVAGNVSIVGTISVGGAGSALSTTTLTVSDPMIGLGKGNVGDTVDLGVFSQISSANTTLNGAINASVTSIVLTSAAGFAASGTIIIQDEEITYTAISTNTLTGCTRGANSTTAATHATATSVIQAKYTGLVRDASDGIFKLFKNLGGDKPTSAINISDATFAYAPLTLGSLIVNDTTSSTVYTEGALIVKGGAGISGPIFTNSTLTLGGTLAVNASGGITTNQSTFSLVNSTATTVNFAGAATTIGIGASTGTLTLNNPTIVSGTSSLTLFNTTATTVSAFGAATTATLGYSGTATSTTNIASGATVSAATATVNILNGITASGGTATLNIGTAGASGSTTNINIGNAVGTSLTTIAGGLSLSQVQETLNTKTGATGTVVHDFTTGAIFYHSTIAANFTANFTNMPTTANKAYAISMILNQGVAGYYPSAVQVNSGAVTLRWANNTAPTASTSKIDIVTFTLFYTGSTWYCTAQYSKFA